MNQDNYINENSKTSNGYKQLRYRRVNLNSELKGENHGRISSNGVCFWLGWSSRTRSFGKTNKDSKRKRGSRRELQGRVNHCLNLNSYRRVNLNSELELQGRIINGYKFKG